MHRRILMYHALEAPSDPAAGYDAGELVYVLRLNAFVEQLDWLGRGGWQAALPEAEPGPRHIVMTFDDGHESNHRLALPELKARSMPACFFITTDWIGTPSFMTDAMLRELGDAGMMVGSHGVSHRFLTDLSSAQVRSELGDSKRRLEDIVGRDVTSVSAPGGRVDRRIVEIAAELGYRDVFTSDAAPSLRVDGMRMHGRLALRRNYTLREFERLMRSGRQPESALRTKGLRAAKKLLGNQRYERARALALRLLARRRR